jgi:dTDP-4-amino-4,6-dideoxygalactose transaminase
LHESFGSNWRLTEMQAAIGRIQLRKLSQWLARRRRSAAILTDSFLTQPALRVTQPPPHVGHAYYKYYVFLRPERLKPGWNRDRIIAAVVAEGVPCFTGSCSEIYREEAFVKAGIGPDKALPVAKALGETSLMFLVHPTLRDEDIVRTGDVVDRILAQATDESWVGCATSFDWKASA